MLDNQAIVKHETGNERGNHIDSNLSCSKEGYEVVTGQLHV